ncbi:hypothetical protein WJ63_14440 [Burkholderia pyrrocinia]|nr:hypothetical protein WJ63_14440 [Burkholderia pyrrocinia]
MDYILIRRIGIFSSVSAWNGIDVVATTKHPTKRACAAAVEVANAYLQAADKRQPTEITIKGAIWICRERHGDTNPYGECVMRKQPSEKVNLIS